MITSRKMAPKTKVPYLTFNPQNTQKKKVGDMYSFLSVLIQKVMNAVLLVTMPSTYINIPATFVYPDPKRMT